ncbi:uridine 5'-monophosphate synthase-like [Achroia grisella]|uniref:uridine 5'-monophosphate synthase-like n=1 Tax=Achroia grisella TaxID=688607 RepID=UPI0027D29608|nr:uridine 5'-monophosphate synthase-like [Achroia grisella]
MIEGHYKVGETCLIIEDVVTSGSSVLETVKDLNKEGLIVKNAVIILDREQGGRMNLESNNVYIDSLFTMTELIDILEKHKKITKEMSIKLHKYLREVKAPVTKEWGDCVTSHSLPGEAILKALSSACTGIENRGVFLLAELSSENTEKKLNMASKNPNIITGFVCQNKDTFKDPGLLQLTPGVQLESAKDDLGQVYNTPEKVILENGADIVVVGRGIVNAKSPEAQAVVYRDALWKCYSKRISGKLE